MQSNSFSSFANLIFYILNHKLFKQQFLHTLFFNCMFIQCKEKLIKHIHVIPHFFCIFVEEYKHTFIQYWTGFH